MSGRIDMFALGGDIRGRTYSWRESMEWARKNMRRYSLASIAQLAFEEMHRQPPDKLDDLRRAPWLTLLLLKWALLDPGVKAQDAPAMPPALFDKLRQRLWEVDPARHRASDLGPHAMIRAILHVQLEMQRAASWEFVRWPMLLLPLDPNSRLRNRYREAFGMEPQDFIDLSQAMFAGLKTGRGILNRQYLDALRPHYGSRVDRVLDTFARDIMLLRRELQSDPAQAVRRAEEYREVPFVQRFPLVPVGAGQLRWWHEAVFARGLENAAHIRLSEGGEEYTRDFSRVFERYVMELAQEMGLLGTVLEDEYKSRLGADVRAVEAIVRDGDCTVLVEGKMGLFPEVTMATDTAEAIFRKTERVRAAIAQAADVAVAIGETSSPFHDSSTRETFALVVTSRELILGDGARLEQLIERPISYRSAAAKAALPPENVRIVSIDSFERLVGAVRCGHLKLAAVLRTAVRADSDPRTARMFLMDHFTGAPVDRSTQPLRFQTVLAQSHQRLAALLIPGTTSVSAAR